MSHVLRGYTVVRQLHVPGAEREAWQVQGPAREPLVAKIFSSPADERVDSEIALVVSLVGVDGFLQYFGDEVGLWRGRPSRALLTRLIPGVPLTAVRGLDAAAALDVAAQLWDRMACLLPRRPFVDLCPQNAMRTPAGQVVLLDFGSAALWQTSRTLAPHAGWEPPGHAQPDVGWHAWQVGMLLRHVAADLDHPRVAEALAWLSQAPLGADVAWLVDTACHLRDLRSACRPSPSRTGSRLVLAAAPSAVGATAYLDDEQIVDRLPCTLELPPGRHRLVVARRGFRPRQWPIEAGLISRLDVHLEPELAPARMPTRPPEASADAAPVPTAVLLCVRGTPLDEGRYAHVPRDEAVMLSRDPSCLRGRAWLLDAEDVELRHARLWWNQWSEQAEIQRLGGPVSVDGRALRRREVAALQPGSRIAVGARIVLEVRTRIPNGGLRP